MTFVAVPFVLVIQRNRVFMNVYFVPRRHKSEIIKADDMSRVHHEYQKTQTT